MAKPKFNDLDFGIVGTHSFATEEVPAEVLFAPAICLDALPLHLVVAFNLASDWARFRIVAKSFCDRLDHESLNHMAMARDLPMGPRSEVLSHLMAAERLASPSAPLPTPTRLLETPEGGGIWCLEHHKLSGLVFAGCWGPAVQVDLIKAWDATTGSFAGALYGHFGDVKCLRSCGWLLYRLLL